MWLGTPHDKHRSGLVHRPPQLTHGQKEQFLLSTEGPPSGLWPSKASALNCQLHFPDRGKSHENVVSARWTSFAKDCNWTELVQNFRQTELVAVVISKHHVQTVLEIQTPPPGTPSGVPFQTTSKISTDAASNFCSALVIAYCNRFDWTSTTSTWNNTIPTRQTTSSCTGRMGQISESVLSNVSTRTRKSPMVSRKLWTRFLRLSISARRALTWAPDTRARSWRDHSWRKRQMQSITGPKTGPIKIPKHMLLRSKTAEVVLELPTKEKSQGGPVDGFPDARRGRLVTKQLD